MCQSIGICLALATCAMPRAEQVRAEVRRLGGASLWPGFAPASTPLAIYDGERSWIFSGDAARSVPGRLPEITANSRALIEGVPTATLLLPPDLSAREAAALAAHEAFHVFQRARHPKWAANEADLFLYPDEEEIALADRRLEAGALRAALDAPEARPAVRTAIARRRSRFNRIGPAAAAYERFTDLNEGLAQYIELRAAGRTPRIPPEEFAPDRIRQRAYATGPALAFLLDRFAPDWKERLEQDDGQFLDVMLEGAIPPGVEMPQPEAEAELLRARREVAALREQRAAALRDFLAARTLTVEAGGEPLWPQNFDPLNVQRLSPSYVLHARALTVGNAAGKLDLFGLAAITEAAGAHPLFQGIRRVVVTGPVEAVEKDGAVELHAPGLQGRFTGATLAREGERTLVRLP